MTPTQLTAFKAAILADVSLVAQRAAGDHGAIAAYYNGAGTGTIWRPSITLLELNTAIVWSEYTVLSALLQNTYMAMIQGGTVDATAAGIRAGFTAVFAGKVSLTNLTAMAQIVPTKFQQLFAVAQVSATFGQSVAVSDIAAALGS